jgi:hypothetical protein
MSVNIDPTVSLSPSSRYPARNTPPSLPSHSPSPPLPRAPLGRCPGVPPDIASRRALKTHGEDGSGGGGAPSAGGARARSSGGGAPTVARGAGVGRRGGARIWSGTGGAQPSQHRAMEDCGAGAATKELPVAPREGRSADRVSPQCEGARAVVLAPPNGREELRRPGRCGGRGRCH